MGAPPATRRFTVEEYHRMAAAGVPEAWLVDLAADRILRARDRSADGFGRQRTLRRSDTIMADAFPGMEIPVGELLG